MTEVLERECIDLDLFLFRYNLTDAEFNALKLKYDSGQSVTGKQKLPNGEFIVFPDDEIENIINLSDCQLSGRFVTKQFENKKCRLVVSYPSGKIIEGKELYDIGDPNIDIKINELYKILRNGIRN